MGISERKAKEKEIRKNDIIDAAEKVFFSKGYTVATMDDVAKTAEFSKRTVYIYFKSKEQIYFKIMVRGYRVLINMIEESKKNMKDENALTQIRLLGEILYRFSKEHPDYFNAIMNYENGEMDFNTTITDESREECYSLGEKIFDYLISALSKGIKEGVVKEDIDVVNTAIVLWSCTLGIFNTLNKKKKYIAEYHKRNPEELLNDAFNMLTKSIER
jgi:AcrR family transcriptional regulator